MDVSESGTGNKDSREPERRKKSAVTGGEGRGRDPCGFCREDVSIGRGRRFNSIRIATPLDGSGRRKFAATKRSTHNRKLIVTARRKC